MMERFGVRLLDRLGKKAFATAAGEEVLERARRIADESEFRLRGSCGAAFSRACDPRTDMLPSFR